MSELLAISPIDGRYRGRVEELSEIFSEYGYIKYRVEIEVRYFAFIVRLLKDQDVSSVSKIYEDFDLEECQKIKEIEKTTNHDVKAIEYYVKNKISEQGYEEHIELVHFSLTSNDINSLAYSLQIRDFIEILDSEFSMTATKIYRYGRNWKGIPMLSRTHGQPATPTTLGKELLVFHERLRNQKDILTRIQVRTKFGGAVGNLNAHEVTYPDIDWNSMMDEFIRGFGIKRNRYTTQVDHYDNHAEVFDVVKRINTILIDMCRDIWAYNSMGYFKLKIKAGEIGSSAMPHKVNPIDFENAEGNLLFSNSNFEFFSRKLPVSRLQRDLTDSTVMRNVGVTFAHTILAVNSIRKGLSKLEINEEKIESDLEDNWIVISEAIQCVLRREGYPNPYEMVKDLTRTHNKIGKQEILEFIGGLNVSEDIKAELRQITPQNYIGTAND